MGQTFKRTLCVCVWGGGGCSTHNYREATEKSPINQSPPRCNASLCSTLPHTPEQSPRLHSIHTVAGSDSHMMEGGKTFGKEWECLKLRPPHHAWDFFPWSQYSVSLHGLNLNVKDVTTYVCVHFIMAERRL
jgi:hypothetical protein